MRNIHKKKILELMDTLWQAFEQLKLQTGQGFVSLCAEMQEFTSGIYDYALDVLGEDAVFAKSLEAFYKELYEAAQGEVPLKQLQKRVRELQGQAKGLKPDRMEIAFLCYKASMADCFETIYFAAKADPQCDAYFIPIPYYDRNPDGSFGTMHLEGIGHYPDTYELIDWQKYDMEARQPDVIFIMNPYDEQNLVTSVHPDFYSKRLKDLTDCLIYVEYGIPVWVYRDASPVQEEIKKHAVIHQAYLHSDFCISYSKELADFWKIAFQVCRDRIPLEPKVMQKKMIELGSPKFDKVIHSKREDYKLPKEWQEKIQNKKVVLYNTSLSELLKSTAQQMQESGSVLTNECLYLKKMRSILQVFYDRDDTVLWWRPHPLFESTLKSMRPELYREYQNIVQEFLSRDCGIYDDTDDLHRAISWSDAMISDESSLLWLYLATNKPFYLPAISVALKEPQHQNDPYLRYPLQCQIQNIKNSQNAEAKHWNVCIWWHLFCDEDLPTNTHFDHFTERFLRYVLELDDYPEREEYESLKKQMFERFVVNPDGTAGQKIYEFAKQKVFS